jgi:hypothetical protein
MSRHRENTAVTPDFAPGLTDYDLKGLTSIGFARESKMSIVLLIALGVGLLAASAGVTFLLASAIPQHVLQRAQENGRFAGLTADGQDEIAGKRARNSTAKPAYHHRTA